VVCDATKVSGKGLHPTAPNCHGGRMEARFFWKKRALQKIKASFVPHVRLDFLTTMIRFVKGFGESLRHGLSQLNEFRRQPGNSVRVAPL
jgi:hypothetical protein